MMKLLRDCELPKEATKQNHDLYNWTRYRLLRANPLARAPWTMAFGDASLLAKPGKVSLAEVPPLAALFDEYCAGSRVSAMKVIRLVDSGGRRGYENESIEYLLRTYDTAKVVHLVRHPYEVLHSRTTLEWPAERWTLENLCRSTLADVEASAGGGGERAERCARGGAGAGPPRGAASPCA